MVISFGQYPSAQEWFNPEAFFLTPGVAPRARAGLELMGEGHLVDIAPSTRFHSAFLAACPAFGALHRKQVEKEGASG